ncbi:MAG: hypothetical protein MUW56_14210 [Chryseobacterium sp.]|uniref:hypothetical protein n=1 Tax=Chryseobacterium sp. TaxID=1871047 RepID=UPI0025B80E86|nr:hypothetical protein [Chryseobacterium sp.]MCJ7934740.1 hypothetical protein [Chryseobacterium sp.]
MEIKSSILYPFRELHTYLDIGIYKDLKSFYASFENKVIGHRIKSKNKDTHIFQIYKDSYSVGANDFAEFSFENHIKRTLDNLIYESINMIQEGINICFINNKSISNYLDKIEESSKLLLNNKSIQEFTFLNQHLKIIASEFKFYRNSESISEDNTIFKESPFKIKENIKRSFFYKLYDISQRHFIIDSDFSKEDFIDVFTEVETSKTIKFICSNSLMITFLEEIREAFTNFKPTSIEQSHRFLTKQGKFLTITNYDSSKQRLINGNPLSEVNNLSEDIQDIFEEIL